MEIVYIPVGVPTFDLEEAGKQFRASVAMLKKIYPDIRVPAEILLSVNSLKEYLSPIRPDLVILQNITFANAEYVSEVITHADCPVILWTPAEPSGNGGRLRLNSLTGAFSAGNAMHALGRPDFEYIFGAPDERDVQRKLYACIEGIRVKKELTSLTIASIGHTPQGFGFGSALDAELRRVFGVRLISVEVRELMHKADCCTAAELQEYRGEITACAGIDAIPAENIERHLRLRKAYADFIKQNNVGALASRCWPDFFTEYKIPVCAVLSLLNDAGVPAACEGDLYGALSMYIASELAHSPVFFGDPVALDRESNTITYWHCGMAATRLAIKPELGVHPNRKIGPVMDFGCRAAAKATVIRIGRKPDATFRLFIAEGEILDKPRQFQGTSMVFKPVNSASVLIRKAVKDGWEPHYIIAPADISDAAVSLAAFLGIEVCRF